VSRRQLYDPFADGWKIESVQPAQFESNPEFNQVAFSQGGPKAWYIVVHRNG
jgi:hypothetical protein